MKASKIDKFLFWMLMGVILLVFVVLFLATVKPAGAASVCGPLVGPAAVVESALTVANIPVLIRERVLSGGVSCSGIGCPKPPKARCLGWSFIIRTAGQGYMVGKTYVPARYVEFWFDKTGYLTGGVR